jgi:hypothetical protein
MLTGPVLCKYGTGSFFFWGGSFFSGADSFFWNALNQDNPRNEKAVGVVMDSKSQRSTLMVRKIHIMRKSARKLTFVAALLSSVFLLETGCAKTGSSTSTSQVTYLSLINGSAYSNNVAVLLNDTLATESTGIPPGGASPRYGTLKPGTYGVKFQSATSDSLLSEIPATSFDTLNFYTLVMYSVPVTGVVQSAKIQDNFSTISSSQANYRFFNLSSIHTNVDLYLNGTVVQQSRNTADNVVNNQLNQFQATNAGTYTITVKSAGTDSTIVTTSNIPFALGGAYTIFLSGVDGSATNPLLINILEADIKF